MEMGQVADKEPVDGHDWKLAFQETAAKLKRIQSIDIVIALTTAEAARDSLAAEIIAHEQTANSFRIALDKAEKQRDKLLAAAKMISEVRYGKHTLTEISAIYDILQTAIATTETTDAH